METGKFISIRSRGMVATIDRENTREREVRAGYRDTRRSRKLRFFEQALSTGFVPTVASLPRSTFDFLGKKKRTKGQGQSWFPGASNRVRSYAS